jgi:hypothetical protein
MSNSPSFFGNNYGVPPSPPASNLRSQYNKEIDRLSEKVTTRLPDGKEAQVYTHSNMLQLEELYDIIKERSALYELKTRIKNILEEHKEQSAEITKAYGIGFLKKRKTKKTRKMRKSRKPVKGRKSCRKTRK